MLVGLYEEARRAYASEGQLFDVHLDMLYHCDLDCEHCYLDDKQRPQLPTAFWLDVIDQLAGIGVFSIMMSGGEIFLRKDLFELIAHARSRAIFVQLKTHGGHIDASHVEQLIALGVSSITLSYYASDPEIHDAITRRPGSHARTLRAMKALKAAGVLVVAACSVMARNRGEVAAIATEMNALQIPVSFDGVIRAAQSGSLDPRKTALEQEDLVDLGRFEFRRKGGCSVVDERPDWGSQKNCVAGHLSLYVDPEAKVSPCVTWPMPVGDLTREKMADIWSRSARLGQVRALRQRDREVCGSCALKSACTYCAGQSWLEHRDANRPSLTVCQATYTTELARARELGLAEPPPPPPLSRPRFPILKSPGVGA